MKNNNVLVIGDLHCPFERPDYLSFCKRIEKAYDCKTVVMIGDLVDNHAISYHEHDPDGKSPADEMRETDLHLKRWFSAFPNVMMVRGNHDRLVDRKGKTVGLPTRCFKSFREMWNLPKGWKDDWSFIIDNVVYEHGLSTSGRTPHLFAAINNRASTVIGHHHSVLGVDYTASERDCVWGMSVGCGVDRHTYAFTYGRDCKKKQIIGCGVVLDKGRNALPLRMFI